MKKHLIIVFVIAFALAVGLSYAFLRIDLIPRPSSLERQSIDHLLKILFAIAGVIFALVIVVFTYSLIFFRRRPGDDKDGPAIKGYGTLEMAWTVIPLLIVMGLAGYAGVVLNDMTRPEPQSELEIDVTASRFAWQFNYPTYGNFTSYELELPVNQRVALYMQSRDVVHSFWVQEFGPKQDVVPGMTTQLRLTPTEIGHYTVQCSQLCGYGHTYMTAPATVVSAADFQTWVQSQQTAPTPTPTISPGPGPTPTSVTVNLMAMDIAFDLNMIMAPAGANVTINFNNMDNVPHNFAVYTNSAATTVIFRGETITGPSTIDYHFTAPTTPGSYFFRCDVHPTVMTGTFIVTSS